MAKTEISWERRKSVGRDENQLAEAKISSQRRKSARNRQFKFAKPKCRIILRNPLIYPIPTPTLSAIKLEANR